jgi:hypothetical protein
MEGTRTAATTTSTTIEQRARRLLAEHSHFRRRADDFRYEYCDGALMVRGAVPSFYLKQILQTVLMRLEGVALINNQVNVVSSEGLSSCIEG